MRVSLSRRLIVGAGLSLALVTVPATASFAAYSPTPRASYSVNGTVFAIAETSSTIYIGGKFGRITDTTSGTTFSRTRLAAFDRSTGTLLPWNPTADNTVRSLAVNPDNGTVYVGGYFANLNGRSSAFAGALNPDGTFDSLWNAQPNKVVRSIVVNGNAVYLAGLFGKVNGTGRAGVAKVAADTGALDPSWRVTMTGGRPWKIAPAANGTDLLVGGTFTTLNGASQSFLGAVSLATGASTSFQPAPLCSTCFVMAIATDGADSVYVGTGAKPGGNLIVYSYATGAMGWHDHADGNVQAVAYQNGIVYAGGHFGPSFYGSVRHQLAAVYSDTGKVSPWNANLGGTSDYPGVWALSADSDSLRVGGGFATVGGIPPARYAEFPTA